MLMRLLMDDHTVKKPVDIWFDVLVKIGNFILLGDFVVFDYVVDFEMTIILGRVFFSMGRALVNMEKGELKFKLNNDEVTFSMCRTMKQPTNIRVVSVIKFIDNSGDTFIVTLIKSEESRYPHHSITLNQVLYGTQPIGLLVKSE